MMQEVFGKVTLGYEDGAEKLENVRPEDELVRLLVEQKMDSRKCPENAWPVLYHLSHLRSNLTQWLPIKETETVLEFGADSGQLTGGFLAKAKEVTALEESISRSRILAMRHQDAENLKVCAGNIWEKLEQLGGTYDWIIAPGLLSEAGKYFSGTREEAAAIALKTIKKYLKKEGHLVLAADNRFGLKYFAGAMEPHTGRYFDSLEGKGTTFSKSELQRILGNADLTENSFYYPYPERWFPMSIYSDQWLPGTGELNTNLRNFEGERLVLFDEEKVYDQLIRDGRFPEFANTYLIVAGPALDVIYSKYSNDRAERFAIRTDILRLPNHEFAVRKVPVTKAAKSHVQDLKHWEEVLDERYRKCGLKANRCRIKNDSAYFEFLHGNTLEERLDSLRKAKDYAGLSSEILKFKQLLWSALSEDMQLFCKSEQFVQMFGNPDFQKAYRGAQVNNLDWIFGNLMETEEGTQIIDYEWTFEVQVPAEYLLWRAVSLYVHSRTDIQSLGLMAQLGISPEEEQLFEEMEHHFQLWLLDGTITIGARYLSTAGRTISLEEMTAFAKKNRIQVYVDRGGGISEADSFWAETCPDKRGITHLELLLPEGTKGLRIDPAESTCLVKVKRILGELGGSYELTYVHNGRELEQQGILYTTVDPQITVTNLVEGTSRVYLELSVEELHPDTAYACMNLLNRVRAAERITQSSPFRFLKKIKHMVKR